jgi:hypothetical protein
MKELMGFELYLHFKFIQEGGGLNLIIIDDKKIELENKMREMLNDITPDKVDSSGNKFYSKRVLYNVMRKSKNIIKYNK